MMFDFGDKIFKWIIGAVLVAGMGGLTIQRLKVDSLEKQISAKTKTINELNGQIVTHVAKAHKAKRDLQESDGALSEARQSCTKRVQAAARGANIQPIKPKVIYVKNEKGENVPSPTQCSELYSVRALQEAVRTDNIN